jgi:hypothetical protein
MSLSFALFFLRDRTSVPLAEDWYIVPALTNHEPDFRGWLWSQNNEHRVPLPRLVSFALLKLTGGKFSAIGALNVVLLSAAAAGLVVFMRHWRGGRTEYADAFFPLLLLNWGHSSHVLFPFLISLVLPVIATLAIGAALAAPRSLSRRPVAMVVGLCLVALPLCGLVGLLYVPGFALGFGLIAWSFWTGRGQHVQAGAAIILASSVVLAAAVSAFYFIGYTTPAWNPPSPGWYPSLRAALRVLSLGFGVAAEDNWRPFILLTIVLLCGTTWCLWWGVRCARVANREGAFGLLLFAVSTIVFGFAVGWGRAGWETQFGIPARYSLLVAPAFVATFMVWDRLGSPRLSRWVPRGLAIVLLALAPWNTRAGNTWFADWYRDGMRSLSKDLAAGLPLEDVARRNQPFLVHWWPPETLEMHMRWLEEAEIRPFARAVSSPETRD